jgi:hypothetical protein
MHIVSTPDAVPSLSQPAPVASWGAPYDWLREEEKTWAWFTAVSSLHVGTT